MNHPSVEDCTIYAFLEMHCFFGGTLLTFCRVTFEVAVMSNENVALSQCVSATLSRRLDLEQRVESQKYPKNRGISGNLSLCNLRL